MSIEVIRTEKDKLISKTPFMSIKQEEIKFKFPLKDTKGDTVKCFLVHEATNSSSAALTMPIKDGFVNIGIKNFEGFLTLGSYKFIVETDEGKKITLPFIMAEEINADSEWTIKFGLPMNDSHGNLIEKELDVKLQIINLDQKSVLFDRDLNITTSVDLGLKVEKSKKIVKGRYEFRMVRDGRVLYRRHYVVK